MKIFIGKTLKKKLFQEPNSCDQNSLEQSTDSAMTKNYKIKSKNTKRPKTACGQPYWSHLIKKHLKENINYTNSTGNKTLWILFVFEAYLENKISC
jgi:hypothetical protein